MKINHTIKAAAVIAAAGLLAACTTPSQAQPSKSAAPMMQGQMKDHMSMTDMAPAQAGQMDMQTMHKQMMKHMQSMADMTGTKTQGMMGDQQMPDGMMKQMQSCMESMAMKPAAGAKQQGSSHRQGKTKN